LVAWEIIHMTITTEEAEELAAYLHGFWRSDITAAALRSLAAERDTLRAENDKLRSENAKLAASNHAYLSDYQEARGEIEKLRAALLLARFAVSHACELSDRILYTQDLRRIDAALGGKE
jgi:hypothetical protein